MMMMEPKYRDYGLGRRNQGGGWAVIMVENSLRVRVTRMTAHCRGRRVLVRIVSSMVETLAMTTIMGVVTIVMVEILSF